MTLDEIKSQLVKMRYEGGWSIRQLSKRFELSQATVSKAMTAGVGEEAQARISAILPILPHRMPIPERENKHKPGRFKRFLIRYYNLIRWLDEIEKEVDLEKRFVRQKQYHMSRERAGYICAFYDYQMKFYLLSLFGEKLKRKKILMCDAYPCESWIERIQSFFPNDRKRLFEKIGHGENRTR